MKLLSKSLTFHIQLAQGETTGFASWHGPLVWHGDTSQDPIQTTGSLCYKPRRLLLELHKSFLLQIYGKYSELKDHEILRSQLWSSQAGSVPWGPAVDGLSAGQREEGVPLHMEHTRGTLPAGTLQGRAVPGTNVLLWACNPTLQITFPKFPCFNGKSEPSVVMSEQKWAMPLTNPKQQLCISITLLRPIGHI